MTFSEDLARKVPMPAWGGDERFAALVAERGAELVKVAMLVTGNRYDAEDAVQDAIVAVSGHWHGVTREGAYAYLRAAVVRKALDGRRRAARTTELLDGPGGDEGGLRFEEDRQFFQMIRELTPPQRAVLALRYFAGVDDPTIARTLGCSRATVRSHAARGLARLRGTTTLTGEAR